MGQCYSCTSKIKRTKQIYDLADGLYDIDERRVVKTLLLDRSIKLDHLQNIIKNSVYVYFVTPKLYVQGLDLIVYEVLQSISTKLGISVIKYITYEEIATVKNAACIRNVLVHIVSTPEDITDKETPLFDVFVCLNAYNIPGSIQQQYLVEQYSKYAILTKTAEYQEKTALSDSLGD